MAPSNPYVPYTITSRGVNDQGNRYDTRIQPGGPGYHYSNRGGSYAYRNGDGSKYFNDGKGSSTYTAPDGVQYRKYDQPKERESGQPLNEARQQDGGEYQGGASRDGGYRMEPSMENGRDYQRSPLRYGDEQQISRGPSDHQQEDNGGAYTPFYDIQESQGQPANANEENYGHDERYTGGRYEAEAENSGERYPGEEPNCGSGEYYNDEGQQQDEYDPDGGYDHCEHDDGEAAYDDDDGGAADDDDCYYDYDEEDY